MSKRAKEGTCLRSLVEIAVPLLQQAERQCPRTGPGCKPEIPDWVMGVLIMVVVLKRKKRKAAQFRFLSAHREELANWLGIKAFPSRSTYYRRYRRAHRLFQEAIRLQGQLAVEEGIADPKTVAVDKSLVTALGPKWNHKDRRAGRIPRGLYGVDRDSAWGFSKHDGWVQGYSYEVVTTATSGDCVFPLLASADTASASEHLSFGPQIDHLPEPTKNVLADGGYDNNDYGQRVEYDQTDRRTGRRFVCAPNRRNDARRRKSDWPRSRRVRQERERRQQRQAFYRSPSGQRLYARRGQTIEPFHERLKRLFELEHRVWHRGLDNNRTQLLASIFSYQLLLRHNYNQGNHNGQVTWMLDQL